MNPKVFYILLALLWLLPLILIAWFWNLIPDTIPIHYNIRMEPDNWGPKGAIFLIPGIMAFLIPFMLAAPKLDPKRNLQNYMEVYRSLVLGVALFLSIITCMEVLQVSGHPMPTNFMPIATVALIAFIGNMLLKLKPSYFVGIRTPWTLENEEVWRRTHRVGGYIWVFASLLMLPVLLLTQPNVYGNIFLGYIGVIALVPIVYSAVVYFNLKKQNKP